MHTVAPARMAIGVAMGALSWLGHQWAMEMTVQHQDPPTIALRSCVVMGLWQELPAPRHDRPQHTIWKPGPIMETRHLNTKQYAWHAHALLVPVGLPWEPNTEMGFIPKGTIWHQILPTLSDWNRRDPRTERKQNEVGVVGVCGGGWDVRGHARSQMAVAPRWCASGPQLLKALVGVLCEKVNGRGNWW